LDIRVELGDVTRFAGDGLVVNLFEGTGAPPKGAKPARGRVEQPLGGATAAVDGALGGAIARLIRAGEARGKWGEQTLVHALGRLPAERILVMGLGKPEEFTLDRIRVVAAEAARTLRKIGARRVGTIVHGAGAGGFNAAQAAQALVEGTLLGLYRFTRYKTNTDAVKAIERLTVLERDRQRVRAMTEAVRRGRILAEAANAARDLVNEPGNTLTPTELARRAQAMARAAGVRCEVFGPRELRRLRAGGLLGVARGSQEPPRLVVLAYRGRRGGPHLGLVGKGVTFDSGGISIKPAERMEAMKGDMAGAAAAIAAVCAIARLDLPIRVTAVVPATENLPSGSALKPGDILRAMSGKTIEVINTDAEGRLILADAMTFAKRRQVTHLVDAATLTGACVVALGTINSGAFANDQAWLDKVLAASRATGEKIWPMPMDAEYDELIKSDIAEIKNTGGRKGGAVTAAKFLQHFAGDTPWVHLDIAGTSESDKEKGYQTKGATGVMARTFVALAMEMLAKG
jgi:leucyl aminopeptidase